MGLGKSLKKIVSHTVAPVVSLPAKAIEKVSGVGLGGQLAIGSGVGTIGAAAGGLFSGRGSGIPGLQGGVPLVNGQLPVGATSGRGVMSAMGGLSGIGSLLGGAAGIYGAHEGSEAQREANESNVMLAREQMAFSAAQADRQMQFQERMSNSSFQRGVEDMKKAGINPILAYSQGGASSPSGAAGSGSAASVDAVPSAIANSVSSSMDMIRTYADVKRGLADADAARAGARNAMSQSQLAEANRLQSLLRSKQISEETYEQSMDNLMKEQDVDIESNRFLRYLDAVMRRLPFVKSATDLSKKGTTFNIER